MKYGIAVIGTGYMARKHCEALAVHPNARLIAICSSSRSRAAAGEFKAQYGFESATNDYSTVLNDPNIDIVFICSPDNVHAAQVCAALDAGKHVFCEKPLTRTEDEFRRIAAAREQSGRVLQVGMNCRFREQYALAGGLVASGDLGSLRFIRGTYVVNVVASVHQQEKSWWSDFPAGVFPFLHGGGIHCLDLLRWIGGEVDSVFARATESELARELNADTFSISLKFAGGAIGELLVAASAFRPNDFSLEMWLSDGSILGTKVFRRQHDAIALEPEELIVAQKIIDIGLQFNDLVRAIETQTEPLNSFAEAEKNFRVLRAIEESVQSGNVVKTTR
jgi:predicted dehydrogenase